MGRSAHGLNHDSLLVGDGCRSLQLFDERWIRHQNLGSFRSSGWANQSGKMPVDRIAYRQRARPLFCEIHQMLDVDCAHHRIDGDSMTPIHQPAYSFQREGELTPRMGAAIVTLRIQIMQRYEKR